MNLLAYKMEDEDENNDDNKNDIDNDDIKNNNINNNSDLNINVSNDDTNDKNSNDKILNEKIYNENNSNEKILNSNEDKKTIRYVSVINNKHFLTKTFLTAKIEFFLIMAFTWLGCYLNINEAFIKSTSAMLWTFIPTMIVIIFIAIVLIGYSLDEEKKQKEKKSKLFLISIILYVPFMVFYCFILTNFTEYKYILMVLSLIIVNFLLLEIYHSFILSNKYFYLTFLPLLIANALLIVLYVFLWIEEIRQLINISIISLVIILYIIFINYQMKEFEEEEYMFGVFSLSYGVFVPAAFLLLLIIAIISMFINCIINKIKS